MAWKATAALGLSIWVTALPKSATDAAPGTGASSIYSHYADATGHAPMLREDAMIFWQSRNRYKSSAIALSVASKYQSLDLPVGVLVIDYNNQKRDGDFAPNNKCYPSVDTLSSGIRSKLNATTMFSFWPEAKCKMDQQNSVSCLVSGALSTQIWAGWLLILPLHRVGSTSGQSISSLGTTTKG